MQGGQNVQTKGRGVQEGGGGYGEDSRTRKSAKDPKTRPGGVLRQPHHFPDWKVLRFFWPRKKEQRG